MTSPVLEKFNLTEGHLIGAGGESSVYGLDDARILRVLKRGHRGGKPYLEKLKVFYDSLPERTFAFPIIHETGEVDGTIFAIENRIQGQALSNVLPHLRTHEKEKVLANYLGVVETLKEITYRQAPYGEFLSKKPLIADTWQSFLSKVIELAVARTDLSPEVPGLETVVEGTRTLIHALREPPKALVHGDYFPENVLVNEALEVTGIIDFSPMTLIGDPMMDVAGALVFLEVLDDYDPADSDILYGIILDRHGPGIDQTIRTYRLYYSFCFSGAHEHPALRDWSLDNLRAFSASL